MLKSERQLLCHVYWSVRKHFLLQKASVSDMQKLLRLCVHIWLPMTSILFLLERQFNATNWDAIISRAKNIFSVFFCNFRNKFKFLTFSRKGWPCGWLFPKLQTLKNKLDQCLISPISEDPSKSNIVSGPKRCWNLNDSSFAMFIDHCDGNLRWKSLR